MTKNRELVYRLADLVCLKLADGEAAELEQDLADIRSMVDRVRTMDLPPETPAPEGDNVRSFDLLRSDQCDSDRYIRLTDLTDHVQAGFLVVPPVLGEDT